MNKEKKKFIRRKAGLAALRGICLLVSIFPFKVSLFLGRYLGFIWYLVSYNHKKTAFNSLGIAFNRTKTKKELKDIVKSSFMYMGEAGLELLSYKKYPNLSRSRVTIVGKENLEKALLKGKGIIGVSAHLGNFPLMALRLYQEGFKINVMARPMRDRQTGEFLWGICRSIGMNIILSYPKKKAIFNSLRALKNNEIITIQMDQNFGTGGVWVKFFGKLAATPVGPVTLALRSGASIVPMFIIRDKPGQHTLFIEKELKLEKAACQEQTILLNVIKITKLIEAWVYLYPGLWSWIHKRWKSRPGKEAYETKFKVQKD
jgi:Kdo2-lipid IVA lauroyltransferase/acyltransferase